MSPEVTLMWEETVAMLAYDSGPKLVWVEGRLFWWSGTLNMNSAMRMLEGGSDVVDLEEAFTRCLWQVWGEKVEVGRVCGKKKKWGVIATVLQVWCFGFCLHWFLQTIDHLNFTKVMVQRISWECFLSSFTSYWSLGFQKLFYSSTSKINSICFSRKLFKGGLR